MSNESPKSFHHGNLRQALIEAGVELARDSGREGIVLREATRMAGVVPNAAYRHFPSRAALVDAVAAHAQGLAADAMRAEMDASVAGLPEGGAEAARARLDAIGRAYVRFGLDESGLFEVAFATPRAHTVTLLDGPTPAPFELLASAIAGLVATGLVDESRARGMEISAWAAVHGLTSLLTTGPLVDMPLEMRAAAIEAVLRMVREGLETA